MRRLLASILLTAALAPSAAAYAADGDGTAPAIDDVDATAYPEVSLVVTVPGSIGGGDLDDAAFTVTENGADHAVTATPLRADDLHVVLLLDSSGSMSGEPVAAMREAALGFVESMPVGVDIAVVSFADSATVLSRFSTDPAPAAAAIQDLAVGGETALYDGLGAAAGLLDGIDGRRVVVLLSDGGDTVSASSLDQALAAVRDGGVGFYAVELQSPESDGAALTRLATAADGTLVSVADPAALSGIFDEIADQLTNRYRVTYRSEAHGDATVAVTVDTGGVAATATRSVTLPAAPPPDEPASALPVDEVAPVGGLRDGFFTTLGFLESTSGLIVGLAAIFLAIAGLVLAGGVGDRSTPTLLGKLDSRDGAPTGTLSAIAAQATNLAERTIVRTRGRRRSMTGSLEKAGVWLRPGELVVIAVGLALGGAALGMMLFGPRAGLVCAAVALIGVRWWLGRKAARRQAAFAEQLPDALQLIAGGLRAGFGLMQTIDNVASEMAAPAGEEFQRVKVEAHLGRDTDEALRAMAVRVGSEDFEWVVQAIEINREVGGDLGEILDSVGETIRDRNRIRRRIKSLSAEGRVSAVVLGILPVALAVLVLIINPAYLAELTTSMAGRLLVAGGIVAMLVGIVWMREITKPKF